MNDPRRTATQFDALIDASRPDEACALLDEAIDDALEAGAIRTATSWACRAAAPLGGSQRSDRVLRWIERILDHADPNRDRVARGRLLAARAGLLRAPRRFAEALDDQTEAIESLQGAVSEEALTTLRHDRAVLLAEVGRPEPAVTGLLAAREAFLGMRDRVGVAAADHNLGFVLHDLGSLDDAIEYLTEARDIFLAIDMPEEAASCDQNLGVVFYDANRLKEAGRRFAVAHHRFTSNEALTSAAECDANLSTLLTTMGRPDEAARYRERAEAAGVGIPTAPGTSTELPAVELASGGDDVQFDGTSGSASA